MNDEKTVHYPLFTQNNLPSPEQETTFPPAHRTLSDKLLSTRQSQDAQRVSFKRTTKTGPAMPLHVEVSTSAP